jgi:ATP/maltotriose-dependent transcriptional regulator MalT
VERGLAVGYGLSRRLIERPRLITLLSESDTRIALLVAPAGYGKTTLARQWLIPHAQHAWYQANLAARDVAALGLGLASAAAKLIPQAGERLRERLKTAADPSAQPEALARDLADSLAGWPATSWLVVDDYHLLLESEPAEKFMETLVASTPMPLLIAGRARPSWVTAKKLLYGEVTELGRTVLAMTHSEAAETLAQSHDDMPGLVSLADGWPAVIGLAALLPSPLPADGTEVPETLHEYFAEELYHGLSDELQWNVFQLSLAHAVDDLLTHALFGKRSSAVLEEAHRSGFLTREGITYEMHPLLRQFLRTKSVDFDSAAITQTVELLGNAYVDEARWDEAAGLADEFSLPDLTLKVIAGALDDILSEGRLATLKHWVERGESIDPAASIVRLAQIELEFRTGGWVSAGTKASDLAGSVSGDDPLASRIYLRAGQIADLDDRLDEALALFTESRNVARTPADIRRALWSRFVTLTDLEERQLAIDALQELTALPPLGVDDLLRQHQSKLHFAIRWGGVPRTLDRLSNPVDLVDHSKDPLVRTGFLQTYGTALAQAARYTDADPIAKRQIEEARRFKLEWVLPHALEMQALVHIGLREFTSALQTLAEAHDMASQQGNVHTQVNVTTLKARVHLCRGAPERAIDVLETRAPRFTSRGMEGDYLATGAFALACCGRTDEAKRLIAESQAVTSHVEARVLRDFARAVASYFDGNSEQVDSTRLSRALASVHETGHFDAFVCAYRAFPALLEAMSKAAVDAQPFMNLATRLDRPLLETLGLNPPTVKRAPSGPLTPRESEILDLVSQGLSNREIAKTLWIAESTVKVHVHHILEKLGARSRTEAVALASRGT